MNNNDSLGKFHLAGSALLPFGIVKGDDLVKLSVHVIGNPDKVRQKLAVMSKKTRPYSRIGQLLRNGGTASV